MVEMELVANLARAVMGSVIDDEIVDAWTLSHQLGNGVFQALFLVVSGNYHKDLQNILS
jgi:hypothetical protein